MARLTRAITLRCCGAFSHAANLYRREPPSVERCRPRSSVVHSSLAVPPASSSGAIDALIAAATPRDIVTGNAARVEALSPVGIRVTALRLRRCYGPCQ